MAVWVPLDESLARFLFLPPIGNPSELPGFKAKGDSPVGGRDGFILRAQRREKGSWIHGGMSGMKERQW